MFRLIACLRKEDSIDISVVIISVNMCDMPETSCPFYYDGYPALERLKISIRIFVNRFACPPARCLHVPCPVRDLLPDLPLLI